MARVQQQAKKRGGALADDIYDQSAAFGRFMALIGLIIGSLIGGGMIIGGVYLLATDSKYDADTTATIHKVQCGGNISESSCTNSGSGRHNNTSSTSNCQTKNVKDCNMTIGYSVNNKEYKSNVQERVDATVFPEEGSTRKVYYNSKDPTQVSQGRFPRKVVGWILLGIGILVVAGAAISFYITRRFKFAAAASGVGTGVGMIANSFN